MRVENLFFVLGIMPVLGITGGIATGKSTFSERLVRLLSAKGIPSIHFCADRRVSELLELSSEVHTGLKAIFGEEVFTEGKVNRARIRELVFGMEGKERKKRLEALLHPLVRETWLQLAAEVRGTGTWLLADIPLLFETGGEEACDAVVVVACGQQTQVNRLEEKRGLSRETALAIIAAQALLLEKVRRADWVIWSDCSFSAFDQQIALLAARMEQKWGGDGLQKEKTR